MSPTSRHHHNLIEQMISRASGARATSGNQIDILLDSPENFPAWEAALLAAQESICIEMYIFARDTFGQRILQILLDKRAAGITVVLIYDWLGSLPAHLSGFFKPLLAAGAHICPYNPISKTWGLNLISRNHRKSIIIDEKIAFVSGLCISSAWQGNPARQIAPWRDTGLRLQGPVVQDILAALEDTLHSQNSHLPLSLHNYENGHQDPCGNSSARVLATTPNNANTMRLDLNLIGLAQQNLWITDAYFMPTRMYIQALINAAASGVDVRILVPRTSDIKWIGTVSRTQYRPLLEAGVRVFEWNGPMLHAKTALIDGQWARVGSTNLNLSSWYINRELDISIEDPYTVYQLERCFINDLNQATEVILDEQHHTQLQQKRAKRFQGYQARHKNQMKGMMRQVMQLSHAFDTHLSGTRLVAPSEAWAYLTIGIGILLFTLAIWFIPQIIVYPLLILMLIGGGGITLQAIKQLIKLKQKNKMK